MKICSKCKDPKELSKFSKDKYSKDGYCNACKVCDKKYREINKEKRLKQIKKYYEGNIEKVKKYQRKYHEDHKEKAKKYQEENKEKRNNNQRKRYNLDNLYKITMLLRSRVTDALKGKAKSSSTLKLLGCSVEFLKQHLEKQFTEGMTWDNHRLGGWEIDHIKPCAKFDLAKPEEQRACFHYTNLQPLWAVENLKKSDKY